MFSASELLGMSYDPSQHKIWNGQIFCMSVEKRDLQTNTGIDGATVFAFVLVKQGSVAIRYNGQSMVLQKNDMHIYAPGMPTEMVQVSDDYKGLCLFIDQTLLNETPLMHYFVKTAYFPIAEYSKPQLTLSEEQAAQMANLLELIQAHINQPLPYQREALLALCELFSIDLLQIQNILVEHHPISTRMEELFAAFLQLLPAHFMEHHDLNFYAQKLCITSTYLSRIVRQVSGSTAMTFIENALSAEAARRLKTTDKSITQLAFDFHFADQASFTKFFTRMKGLSPKEFRRQHGGSGQVAIVPSDTAVRDK